VQIPYSFLDRCVELSVDHKLKTESASMINYLATDICGNVVDKCLQLFGGYEYIWDYPVAGIYVDNRLSPIYAGTNEIMKLVIALELLKDF